MLSKQFFSTAGFPHPFVAFICNVKNYALLLLCSAGCGRTGSLIAINVFRELLNTNVSERAILMESYGQSFPFQKLKKIDVKQIVIELRKQRVCMVQTLVKFFSFFFYSFFKFPFVILAGSIHFSAQGNYFFHKS